MSSQKGWESSTDYGHDDGSMVSEMVCSFGVLMRKLLFRLLAVGSIPNHMAFILDGNRRYAKKWELTEGEGHNAGFLAVIRMLKYCFELGVKYVTIYAFSLDNYKRKPHEVQLLMNLFRSKMNEMETVKGVVLQFGVRIFFCGDLSLLSPTLKDAAESLMKLTEKNTRSMLCVCLAYTSSNEITRAVRLSCEDRLRRNTKNSDVSEMGCCCLGGRVERIVLRDVEKGMDMGVAPEPDILVRTSGETRLSNFLLWQTPSCLLYSPPTLWPEFGLRELVWSVLSFQRCSGYLEKKRFRAGFFRS